MDAFVKRLRELGYDEGQNLAFEYVKVPSADAYAEGIKEVVGRHVDIIIAQGPEEILKAAMAATNKLPIVMIAIDFDPFARGYVTNLAHPTGNVTGIAFQQIELSAGDNPMSAFDPKRTWVADRIAWLNSPLASASRASAFCGRSKHFLSD